MGTDNRKYLCVWFFPFDLFASKPFPKKPYRLLHLGFFKSDATRISQKRVRAPIGSSMKQKKRTINALNYDLNLSVKMAHLFRLLRPGIYYNHMNEEQFLSFL